MIYSNVLSSIDGLSAVRAVSETLKRIDERLIEHGERVAFIACEMAKAGSLPLDFKLLHLLCIFHDIGAYKTDEIDRMVEFETHDVSHHSIYGYLFLKYLTPLFKEAEAILYHHSPWKELKMINSPYADYSAIINLADRVDIVAVTGDMTNLETIRANADEHFCPEYVSLFFDCFKTYEIFEKIKDGRFRDDNLVIIKESNITTAEALEYLKMVVYSIDFRSEQTVTHTSDTELIAMNIAERFGLSEAEKESIELGAFLHDVGKIAIPYEILEFKGRLSPEQMAIMRTHVNEGEKLLAGTVPDSVLQIVVRHHEKLDGSGYPRGLTEDSLDLPQRIIAVADIVSALCNQRSYKEPFPKEKTISILRQMSVSQLDKNVCDYVCDFYDKIMSDSANARSNIISKYQAIMDEFNILKGKY